MTRILIWDIPTRLFHALLALAFTGAFAIPHLIDDDRPLFMVHMLLGGTMAFMVTLRVIWGFVGPKHSRFSALPLRSAALLEYIKGTVRKDGPRYPGHNPASAIAAALMLLFSLGLAGTGVLMGSLGEWAEELHEFLAYALLTTVVLHLAGLAWHSLRHRENIALAMVDGRKLAEPTQAIASPYPLTGLTFLVLTGLWAGILVHQYDAPTRSLQVPGLASISLGEGEDEGREGAGHDGEDDDDDDD